jgi:hypothetical protein
MDHLPGSLNKRLLADATVADATVADAASVGTAIVVA